MNNRYVTGNSEETYQQGSNSSVLLNKLGVVNPKDMDDIELRLLEQLSDEVINQVTANQKITVEMLYAWHRRWLGNIYSWAGRTRIVNLGKEGFHFAVAAQIMRLMIEFDEKFLAAYTPCAGVNDEQLIHALSLVHIEFILIHSFREGNGRLSRLLANVMALQAGKPLLDFSYLDNHKAEYITAIHAGLTNAETMKELFKQVLRDTEERAAF